MSGILRPASLSAEVKECEPATVALSPDGSTLAFGGGIPFATPKYRKRTTHVALVDVESGALRAVGRGHSELVQSMAFSADGATVVSVDVGESVVAFDAQSGEKRVGRKASALATTNWLGGSPQHASRRIVRAARAGGRVVAGGGNAFVCWASADKLNRPSSIAIDPAPATAPSPHVQNRLRALALSPDGRFCVTAGAAQRLDRWAIDQPDGPATHQAKGMFFALDWSPDGTSLVALEAFGDEPEVIWDPVMSVLYPWKADRYRKRLVLLDPSTLARRLSLDLEGNPQTVAFSGGHIVAAGTEADRVVVRLYALESGSLVDRLEHPVPLPPQPPSRYHEPFWWVRDLAVASGLAAVATPDGVRLFSLPR